MNPVFDIKKSFGWDALTNKSEPVKRRSSDIFVFCICTVEDNDIDKLLDMKNWDFYVVSTKTLDRVFNDQKTISLNRLKELTSPLDVDQLKQDIDKILLR